MGSEINRVSGYLLSDSAARLWVLVVDELAKMSRARGATLSAAVVDMRNEVYAAVFRPQDDAADATQPLAAVLEMDSSAVISTKEAARRAGTTASNMQKLCAKGARLDAERVNGRWWIVSSSLDAYLESRAR